MGERGRDEAIYFDDAVVGQRMELGTTSVDEASILRFANEFDPQAFHIDKEAAARSIYGGLIASGWHTCSIAKRLLCDGFLSSPVAMGSPGVDEIRWRMPVRAGDRLTGYATVLEARSSRSKPDRGIIVTQVELHNQRGDVVLTMRAMAFMKRRGASEQAVAVD